MQHFLSEITDGYRGPSRKVVAHRIDTMEEEKRNELKKSLESVKVINFTTDIWSDSTNDSYVSVTGHFLDEDFILHDTILDFVLLKGNHTGETIASEYYLDKFEHRVETRNDDDRQRIQHSKSVSLI